MRTKKIRILFFLLFLYRGLFAQSVTKGYVIFSFEDDYKISYEGKIIYCWITPQDSINSPDFNLSHLFVCRVSAKDVVDCRNGKAIDPRVIFNEPNDTADDAANDQIDLLKNLLTKSRKKIMSIRKKWPTGQEETVVIYATPVIGEFCFTDYHKIGNASTKYGGKVCVPLSTFSFDKNFWGNSKSKFVLHKDYSNIDFDIIPY